ncbi:MAG: preprotein translocase subunit SecE [Pseudomonadota bacterium]
MGSDRKWIYLSYLGATLLLAWVLDQSLRLAAGMLRIHNPQILGVLPATAVIAGIVMAVTAYFYFRQPKVDAFSSEVAQELRKVTWPDKNHAGRATLVVIVLVIVMAVILGIFDWICTHLLTLVLAA